MTYKRCRICGISKPLSAYHKSGGKHLARCKQCVHLRAPQLGSFDAFVPDCTLKTDRLTAYLAESARGSVSRRRRNKLAKRLG